MNSRVLIAGTNSGCGKTTLTLAILSALKKRGVDLSGFKCGPDYIDPMFHRKVLGIPSYNVDPFFCSDEMLCNLLAGKGREISVIEGVMGYYDGVGINADYSSYSVARATKTPVILIVNIKGMYASARPIISGFKSFREDSCVQGVIFNSCSAMMYGEYAKMAEAEGVKPLGFFPVTKEVEIGSRHLGLVTADEILDMQHRIDILADVAEKSLDLDGIIALADSAPELTNTRKSLKPVADVKLGVARDEAFCFIYEENLELLSELGCELVNFSPVHDKALPEGINALYLPGGYPELYEKELSANKEMLESVKKAICGGMPTVAECGGFLYLHELLDGVPMASVFAASADKKDRLQRFGYVSLTAKKDNMLCKEGETIKAHEFHYYDSTDNGADFEANKPLSKRHWECVHTSESLYAGFPHLYFPSNIAFAENFVKKASEYESIHL